MGFRLQKRIKLGKGISLNLSKHGIGMSVGPKGLKYSIGPRGPRIYAGKGPLRFEQSLASKKKASLTPKTNSNNADALLSRTSSFDDFFAPEIPQKTSPWLFVVGGILIAFISMPTTLLFGGALVGMGVFRLTSAEWKATMSVIEGKTALIGGRYGDALTVFEKASAVLPGYASEFKKAIMYCKHRIVPEQDSCEFFIRLFNREANLPCALVCCESLASRGLSKELIDFLQDNKQFFIADDHLNIFYVSLLGEVFCEMGEYDVAIEVLKSAPFRKRSLGEALLRPRYLLGNAYLFKGNKKQALQHFNKVISFDSNFKDVQAKIDECNV